MSNTDNRAWAKLYVDEQIAIDKDDALRILTELANTIQRDRQILSDPTQSVSVKYIVDMHLTGLEQLAAKIRMALEEYKNE